ncbi:MAG: MATE family efflux transporter [Thermoleophilia bacterium]
MSMLGLSFYNLVNVLWVAKLGYRFVAGITIVIPFWVFCLAIGVGTGVGANALASRRFGEGDMESANQVAGQMFFLAFVIGTTVLLATQIIPQVITGICGATPDIMGLANEYIMTLGWGMPFLFLGLIGRNVFQASGDAVRPMIFTIAGLLATLILDPFLIFGWWVFPSLGISGAALATNMGNALSAAMMLFFLFSRKTSYHIHLRHLLVRWRVIWDIYRIALPTIVMEMTESLVFALYNNVIAGFGSLALAAFGIAGRILDILFMPIFGVSQGLLPIVGFSFGAKLWKRLWRVVKMASVGTAVAIVIPTICLEILAPQVVSLFTNDPELKREAVLGTRIMMSTLAIMGPTIMFITTFQGLSKAKEAMILSLVRQFVCFLPAVLLLPRYIGLTGVWLATPISESLAALTAGLWLYWEYGRRRGSLRPWSSRAG